MDAADSCDRILLMDFSSAFNTVNINTLLWHLEELHVHQTLILWINSFLLNCPQHVLVNGRKSENVVLNTGLPQGCVLSPILFAFLYK